MELMSANELYEVSRIKHNDKTIADALWRAAISGSVELFMHGIDEMTKKKLLEKGYHVEAGNYPVGEEIYEYRIYWGKEIKNQHMIIFDPEGEYTSIMNALFGQDWQELTQSLEENGYKIVKLKLKEEKHGTDRKDETDAG